MSDVGRPRDRACARSEDLGKELLSRCARGVEFDRLQCSLRHGPAAALALGDLGTGCKGLRCVDGNQSEFAGSEFSAVWLGYWGAGKRERGLVGGFLGELGCRDFESIS